MAERESLRAALESAWHRESAAASLERWRSLCATEHWTDSPRDIALLARIFGASWYFTRFLFYRGAEAARLLDVDDTPDLSLAALLGRARSALQGAAGEREESIERLRIFKNECMLQILALWLCERLPPRATELALSSLAEAVLQSMLALFGLIPGRVEHRFAVLGMGRLAGCEMGFGSDLDLIFLYESGDGVEPAEMSRGVRRILRNMATASPAGLLYEVDMRLRPHGTAGTLITSVDSFIAHHAGEREVWERQLMTRCRPVFDPFGIGAAALDTIRPCIYDKFDPAALSTAIHEMRLRVERELGHPRGKIEIKRGTGGVMDIDFMTHYLQLAHGHARAQLRTPSTREALQVAGALGLLGPEVVQDLQFAYEFLRRVENCLRLFDLKNVSAMTLSDEALDPLCRAFGFSDDHAGFLDQFTRITTTVRGCFDELLTGVA